ncbi:hypothetical protein [Streptomyces sp. NPDC053755]|uniref:hypothetical protein n=1 Tax=Streptomyces sp. NPDC053755 TaxID=3155815 RepID=UPI0034282943
MLVATSCSDETPKAAADRVCAIAPGSAEDKLLRQVMRAETFSTDVGSRDSRFVEKMQDALRSNPEYRTGQCEFHPNGKEGNGQATIDYGWSPVADADKVPGADTRRYELNGAKGTSDDVMTHLYVPCDLPGELKPQSRKVLLHANAAFTVNLGAVKDHGTQDEQMSFLYSMARKAADVLGCENKPLAGDPVVKPLTGSTSS